MARKPLDPIKEVPSTREEKHDDLAKRLERKLREERAAEEERLADLAIGKDQSAFAALDREAKKEWEQRAHERTEFSQSIGNSLQDHEWKSAILRQEATAGRVENVDFAFRHRIKHPDGKFVEYDYVDLKRHHIVDLKPALDGQKQLTLAGKYLAQQRRHIEAYRTTYGVEPTYEYALYPSTKHLFGKRK